MMPDKYILVIVFIILFCQASWMFYDASKRGGNKWIWGLFGLINAPSSLIIYLIITRIVLKTRICPHCLYQIKSDSKYCSYCGEPLEDE